MSRALVIRVTGRSRSQKMAEFDRLRTSSSSSIVTKVIYCIVYYEIKARH